MKKLLTTLVCALLFAGSAYSQSFFDNTFVGGGVGVGMASIRQLGIGPDLYFGKWFSPSFASRIGWNGVFSSGLSFNSIRADAMLDLISLIKHGEDHKFSWIPFLSLGIESIYRINESQRMIKYAPIFGGGTQLSYRVAEKFHITLDSLGFLDFDPTNAGVIPFIGPAAASYLVGIRYDF